MRTSYHIRVGELKSHIEKSGRDIPTVTKQAQLLGVSRASLYYQPKPIDPRTLFVMNRIDEVYTKRPFYGVRRITEQLRRDGILVNHKRVHHLMKEMGLAGLIPKRNLSKNTIPHPVYPYLLKGVTAAYPNHIWGTDITYIRLSNGFLYLVAFLDWFSRFIVSWRLSTTLEVEFVLEAAEEALQRYQAPEIENSDQGIQYTHEDYINIWKTHDVQISMDGRGRAMDNIFNERFWRSLKYEEVYLKSYETVLEAKENIGAYIDFYNNERFHQSLKNRTPSEIYFGNFKKGGIVI